mmetsp:Transcript_20182/g.48410  ORF Transcript_20182/g.48410 Transcript_20182/m.48410 type:complete len:483 (-) Transcript_20182:120-1568(-)
MRLVEHQTAIKLLLVAAVHRLRRPCDQLIHTRLPISALRDERRVGAEDDPIFHLEWQVAVRHLVQRVAIDVIAPQVVQVAAAVVEQRGGDGAPDGPSAPLYVVVDDDRGDLPAFAHASAVANEEAAATSVRVLLHVTLPRVNHRLQLRGGERALAVPQPLGALQQRQGERRLVVRVGRLDARHGARLDDRLGVVLPQLDLHRLVRREDGLLGVVVLLRSRLLLEHVCVLAVPFAQDAVLLQLPALHLLLRLLPLQLPQLRLLLEQQRLPLLLQRIVLLLLHRQVPRARLLLLLDLELHGLELRQLRHERHGAHFAAEHLDIEGREAPHRLQQLDRGTDELVRKLRLALFGHIFERPLPLRGFFGGCLLDHPDVVFEVVFEVVWLVVRIGSALSALIRLVIEAAGNAKGVLHDGGEGRGARRRTGDGGIRARKSSREWGGRGRRQEVEQRRKVERAGRWKKEEGGKQEEGLREGRKVGGRTGR